MFIAVPGNNFRGVVDAFNGLVVVLLVSVFLENNNFFLIQQRSPEGPSVLIRSSGRILKQQRRTEGAVVL